jgi:hypothetical protein
VLFFQALPHHGQDSASYSQPPHGQYLPHSRHGEVTVRHRSTRQTTRNTHQAADQSLLIRRQVTGFFITVQGTYRWPVISEAVMAPMVPSGRQHRGHHSAAFAAATIPYQGGTGC